MTGNEQDVLLERIRDLIGEHAINFVVAVELPHGEDDTLNAYLWGGHFNAVTGLSKRLGAAP